MKVHHIESSKVKVSRSYSTEAEAIAAYERKCKRMGVAPPLHYPGAVAGDTTYKVSTHTSIEGVRDGHGMLYHSILSEDILEEN